MSFSSLQPLPYRLGSGAGCGEMEEIVMTDMERARVLKMIADGRITPEEGLRLMQTLEQNPAEDGQPASGPETGETPRPGVQAEPSSFEVDPRINGVKSIVRRLWQIPLWIGIGITILGALGMYWVMQSGGLNFWFYSLSLPVLLGVLIIVAAVGSRKARWIFVDVHQKPGDSPRRIFLGFPLPLRLTAWFLRVFGHKIPNLENTNVDEIIQAVETGFTGDTPLIVNVDEGDDGERVRVYIG